MSDYMAQLRAGVGHRLLLIPAAIARIRDDDGRVLLLRLRPCCVTKAHDAFSYEGRAFMR